MSSFFKNWLPVILWAGLIFFFSTEQFSFGRTETWFGALLNWFYPGIPADFEESIHHLARKLGHWSAYFVFALLLVRAMRLAKPDPWQWRRAVWTLILIFLYALSDEWHQSFVPSRGPSLSDVLLDFFGGLCGVLWVYFRQNTSSTASPRDATVQKKLDKLRDKYKDIA